MPLSIKVIGMDELNSSLNTLIAEIRLTRRTLMDPLQAMAKALADNAAANADIAAALKKLAAENVDGVPAATVLGFAQNLEDQATASEALAQSILNPPAPPPAG